MPNGGCSGFAGECFGHVRPRRASGVMAERLEPRLCLSGWILATDGDTDPKTFISNDISVDSLGGRGLFLLQMPVAQDIGSLVAQIASNKWFRYIEPNASIAGSATSGSDPQLPHLWGLEKIQAPPAWDIVRGDEELVIAVLDSGMDYTHPDLTGNLWTNPGEIPGDNIDNDDNGLVDDVHGYDFANADADPMDDAGHGTHVAGIIGAQGDNAIGGAGVAWSARLMPLKILKSNLSGDIAAAVKALNYVADMRHRGVNVRIANNSWVTTTFSQALYDAVAACEEADVLVTAAAGNSAGNVDGVARPAYPAAFDLPNVISVAATNDLDARWPSSNYGAVSVDIAAPGVGILSTRLGGDYESKNGTSQATAFASGVAALAYAVEPEATYAIIREAIFTGGDTIASMQGLTATGKRLNAFGALMQLPTESITFTSGSATIGNIDRPDGSPRSLILAGSAQVHVKPDDAGGVMTLTGLDIRDDGRLDLAEGEILLQSPGRLVDVEELIRGGRIITSAALLDPTITIGTGLAPDGTSIRIACARAGDANLDGRIDMGDFLALAKGYVQSIVFGSEPTESVRPHFATGDFNYDRVIDMADFASLSISYVQYRLSILPVTEPASAADTASSVAIPHLKGAISRRRRGHFVVTRRVMGT